MPSRVRFTLPTLTIRPAYFEYAFEPASTRCHHSSPSSFFDSTLETLQEESELDFQHSFDSLERVEENDGSICAMTLPRPSKRKPFAPILNRIVEE